MHEVKLIFLLWSVEDFVFCKYAEFDAKSTRFRRVLFLKFFAELSFNKATNKATLKLSLYQT